MSEKGNAILLRARQKFGVTRVVETLRKIEVPEWEATVYYWPTRDLSERLASEQFVKFGADRTMADLRRLNLANILTRARDERGERLFSDADEAALADTHQDVIARISGEMGFGDGLALEEAEKN
jgi:hypothetical protein